MNRHDEIGNGCGNEELLVSVLYDEATAGQRAELETHMRSCDSCRADFAAFREVRGDLKRWEAGPVPRVTVEIKPGFAERLRQAFALLPSWGRLAAAGACALLVLSVLNADVSVGPNGFRFSTSLVPRGSGEVVAGERLPAPASGDLTPEQEEHINQLVAERCDAQLRERLATAQAELKSELDVLQKELATAHSSELRQMAARVEAQRRKIDSLQRDIDRQAGYGGSDLFSMVLNDPQPGS
jgi:hypothetical protein